MISSRSRRQSMNEMPKSEDEERNQDKEPKDRNFSFKAGLFSLN